MKEERRDLGSKVWCETLFVLDFIRLKSNKKPPYGGFDIQESA